MFLWKWYVSKHCALAFSSCPCISWGMSFFSTYNPDTKNEVLPWLSKEEITETQSRDKLPVTIFLPIMTSHFPAQPLSRRNWIDLQLKIQLNHFNTEIRMERPVFLWFQHLSVSIHVTCFPNLFYIPMFSQFIVFVKISYVSPFELFILQHQAY